MQYYRSDQSEHVLLTHMNDVTRTCNNTEIRNDGGEESIAFLGKTNLAATSLSVPYTHPERQVEHDGSVGKQIAITFLWRRNSMEYNHTKVFCIRCKIN